MSLIKNFTNIVEKFYVHFHRLTVVSSVCEYVVFKSVVNCSVVVSVAGVVVICCVVCNSIVVINISKVSVLMIGGVSVSLPISIIEESILTVSRQVTQLHSYNKICNRCTNVT